MGSSTVGLDWGLSSRETGTESPLLGLMRAPEARLPMACMAPREIGPREPSKSFVEDWGERRRARERIFLMGFSSRLIVDRFIDSSALKDGSEGDMEGETVWEFRKGMKIDSSIRSWIRLTAASRVSGAGGTSTFWCRSRGSRSSLDRLISRGEPG